MGSLNLHPSEVLYADTQVFIYTVERHPRYFSLLRPLWEAAMNAQIQIFTSELALLETLVLPLRNGDTSLQQDFEHVLLRSPVRLLPITETVLREAAQLRADYRALRTPDALHAATARTGACTRYLTNDVAFRRIAGLPVELLDDVLNAP